MQPSPIAHSLAKLWAQVYSTQSLPFPAVVSSMLALGVTRYHVDYTAANVTHYTAPSSDVEGPSILETAIPKHSLGSPKWNKDQLVDAIRWAQAGPPEYGYEGFVRKCLDAGVTDYTAYLEGHKVVYASGSGDLHVEWFPGFGPEK
jgi:uncharacterized protein YbcV (DUF1398 family)